MPHTHRLCSKKLCSIDNGGLVAIFEFRVPKCGYSQISVTFVGHPIDPHRGAFAMHGNVLQIP
jgi:hypothetical protein